MDADTSMTDAHQQTLAAEAAVAAAPEQQSSASAAGDASAAAQSSDAQAAAANAGAQLSEEERAIYDRQLRVWGVEAQKRMRESSVLVVGALGLGAEVAKNLVLAGVGSLVLLDGASVSINDLSANCMLRFDDVGRNRAEACVPQLQLLNPNVAVSAQPHSAESVLVSNPSLFSSFRAVCLVGQSLAVQSQVNELLRTAGAQAAVELLSAVPGVQQAAAASNAGVATPAAASPTGATCPAFFSGECAGLSGWFVEDLCAHAYTEARRLRDAATGKETDEEVLVAGVAAYPRSAAQLLSGEGQPHAEVSKRFGRKAHEKAACAQWTALRLLMQWRDQQRAALADPAASLPSLSNAAVFSESLLPLRAAMASREGFDAERVLPQALLQSLGAVIGVEVAHVCAIVGGILGQEILKVLSGKDRPLANTFVFEATQGYGIVKEL